MTRTYAERARDLVDRWLNSPACELELDEFGTTLGDTLQSDYADEARKMLERRIADALRRSWS